MLWLSGRSFDGAWTKSYTRPGHDVNMLMHVNFLTSFSLI